MSSNEISNKPEAYLFDQYLSFLDLEYHKDWEAAWVGQDEKLFEQVLQEMGADLSTGWEITDCLHRSRFSGKVDRGPRVVFKERVDDYWIRNGMAVEDMVRSTKSEISRVGCMLALNNIHNVAEATQAKMMNNVSNVNIACKE